MLSIYVPGCKAAYILTKPCGNRSQGPHEPITLTSNSPYKIQNKETKTYVETGVPWNWLTGKAEN